MKINSELHYLGRAVDHEGEVLEFFVTKKRDKSAALAFMKKALKRFGRHEAIITDGLRSYPAVIRQLGNPDRREMGRWKNNRAKNRRRWDGRKWGRKLPLPSTSMKVSHPVIPI